MCFATIETTAENLIDIAWFGANFENIGFENIGFKFKINKDLFQTLITCLYSSMDASMSRFKNMILVL